VNRSQLHEQLNIRLSEPRLNSLFRQVRDRFLPGGFRAHDWPHVLRDLENALEIGLAEEADLEIVLPAVLLHDLGYVTHPESPELHPLHGSRECLAYLDPWTEEQRRHIASCILRHKARFPGFENLEPGTLEEKVVCDADQLDKFGWTGLMQMMKVFVELGMSGKKQYASMEGLAEGIGHQGEIRFYTATGQKLARKRGEPDFLKAKAAFQRELAEYYSWPEELRG